MTVFNAGEVIVIPLFIKDIALNGVVGILTDPTTTPILSIYDPNGTEIIASANMAFSAAGQYVYNWQSLITSIFGRYKVKFTATDGTIETVLWADFTIGN